MKNVSNAFKEKMSLRTDFYPTAEITFADGTVKNLSKSDFLVQGNTVVQGGSSSSFPLGILSSKQITLSLLNNDDKWEEYGFYNAKIRLFTNYQINDTPILEEEKEGFVPEVEKIQEGIFTVISPESYGTTIQINAMDESYKADTEYFSTLLFPARLDDVLRDVCSICGISLYSADIPNKDFIIKEKPSGGTCRDIIGCCAMIAGGNAVIDSYNRLKIVSYDLTAFSNEEKAKDIPILSSFKPGLSLEAIDVVITGVQIEGSEEITNEDGNTTTKDKIYKYGSDGYVLTLKNYLAAGNEEAFIKAVGDIVIGLKFRTFTGDSIANPLLEFMDNAYIQDYKGRTFQTVITYVDFSYFGLTVLKCTADTPLRNSQSGSGDNAKQLKQLIEKEKTERERALARLAAMISSSGGGLFLTKEELEDKSSIYYAHDKQSLQESKNIIKITANAIGFSTDGGETYPFIISYDGESILRKIYAEGIDADYITAGHITADRIRGGTMTLGGLNNEKGALYILDAKGNVVGTLDNQGIHTIEGVFEGDLKAAKGTFAGDLQAAGGTFTGNLSAAGGTFSGDLSAAGGTFSGDLSAAGGTFYGDLMASGGTFNGNLVAAGGTFSGNLSAAGGTFNGELQAVKGTFAGELQATTGTFLGKLQSGDLDQYGIVIDEGVIKGYKKNQNTAYISSNQTITVDNVSNYGLRIASQGGISLRGPYLCVAKDYIAPNQGGTVELGVDSTIRPITNFTTVGEGADRKLQFTYGNVRFVNGICVSTTSGVGTSTTDLPEVQAPVGENTYQADAEALVRSHIVDTAFQERAIDESKFVPYYDAKKVYSISWEKDLIINCNDVRTTNTNCPHFSSGWIDISAGYYGDFPIIRSFPGPFNIATDNLRYNYIAHADANGNIINTYYTFRPLWFVYVGQNNGNWYVSHLITPSMITYMRRYAERTDGGTDGKGDIASSYSWIGAYGDSLYGSRWPAAEGLDNNHRGWMGYKPSALNGLFTNLYPNLVDKEKKEWNLNYDNASGSATDRNRRYSLAIGNYLGIQVFWKDGKLFYVPGICFKEGDRVYWSDVWTSKDGRIRFYPDFDINSIDNPYSNQISFIALKVNLTKNKLYAFDDEAAALTFRNHLITLKE